MTARRSPIMLIEEGFEIHGVRVGVGASDPEVFDRLIGILPAGVQRCDPATVEEHFRLLPVGDDAWHFVGPNGGSGMFADLTLLLGMVDTALRRYVANNAPERVFVHAGAVAHRGRAILIPGSSFSGKSTLVGALVRAGAEYYSDEYAVLDEQGHLHPYARPLSVRGADPQFPDLRPVESLGGPTGEAPVPVGLIAATEYRSEAGFRPERLSAGQAILTLLEHTSRTHDRPEETMTALRRAVDGALVVRGHRGEADAAARELLKLAAGASVNGAGPTP